jgi:hypothetical protein
VTIHGLAGVVGYASAVGVDWRRYLGANIAWLSSADYPPDHGRKLSQQPHR